jgi:hypothetical protein
LPIRSVSTPMPKTKEIREYEFQEGKKMNSSFLKSNGKLLLFIITVAVAGVGLTKLLGVF